MFLLPQPVLNLWPGTETLLQDAAGQGHQRSVQEAENKVASVSHT